MPKLVDRRGTPIFFGCTFRTDRTGDALEWVVTGVARLKAEGRNQLERFSVFFQPKVPTHGCGTQRFVFTTKPYGAECLLTYLDGVAQAPHLLVVRDAAGKPVPLRS